MSDPVSGQVYENRRTRVRVVLQYLADETFCLLGICGSHRDDAELRAGLVHHIGKRWMFTEKELPEILENWEVVPYRIDFVRKSDTASDTELVDFIEKHWSKELRPKREDYGMLHSVKLWWRHAGFAVRFREAVHAAMLEEESRG